MSQHTRVFHLQNCRVMGMHTVLGSIPTSKADTYFEKSTLAPGIVATRPCLHARNHYEACIPLFYDMWFRV